MIIIIIINRKKRKRRKKKKERKKERNTTACHWDSTLKRTSLYLIYPQKCHSCTLRYILVLLGTNVHLYEYKLQRCFIRVLLFTYFTLYFVYVVCTVYMAHSNGYLHIHILLYSVLFYYTVHVSGIKYKK